MSNEEQQILNIKVNYADAIKGVAEYKSRVGELKAMQERLKEEFKDGTITAEEYNKTVAAIEEQTKAYKSTMRELSKEVQNNIKQQKEQQGSLRQMRAELSNCTKEYDALSKAEREGAKGQELKKHINEITDSLKKAEEETQRYYRNVGNYENAIKNALGVNSDFANSILSLASNGKGIQGMLDGASTSAKAFGATLKGFLANPVFLALAGIAGMGVAFKWFYDYNKGIEESTRLTREFLGVTGDSLQAIRSSIQATADTYGKDFKSVLEGVDTIMVNFGVNAEQALAIINEGFAAGADLNGDMLAKIQANAAAFHDAGISAGDMVGMIQQTRSGLFTDKGLELVKMASVKLREMSTTTVAGLKGIGIDAESMMKKLRDGTLGMFDAVKMVAAKLGEVPSNSKEAAEAIKAVFGKSGAMEGQEMLKMLAEMNVNLEDLTETTGEHGKAIDESREATEELHKVSAALFDASGKGFGELGTNIKTIATKWLTELLKGIVKAANYCIDLYNNAMAVRAPINLVVGEIKMLWSAAKVCFNLIVDGLKSLGRSFKSFATIVEGALTFNPKKMLEGIEGLGKNMLTTFKEGWNDIGTFVKDEASAVVDMVNNTIKNKKIDAITIPTVSEDGTPSPLGGGASGGGNSGGASGKGGKASSAEAAKKEAEELRKAEDLLMQLIEQNTENLRKALATRYDRQLEDLRKRLAEEKNLTETARNAITAQIIATEELKAKALAEFDIKVRTEEIQRTQMLIELKLETIKKGSDEELSLLLSKLGNEEELEIAAIEKSVMNEEQKQNAIALIRQKYAQAEDEAIVAHNNAALEKQTEAIKKQYEAQILQAQINGDGEMEVLRLKMDEKKALMDEAQQREGETLEAFNLRKLQLDWDYQQSKEAVTQKEIEVEKGKQQAITTITSAISNLAQAFGEENKALAKASKVVALGEIAINTGVALAQGIKQAQKVPYPANLAAIATTVATVLANVATAVKTVKGAKFATGGLVTGPGTATSDSIPASLSNGESVMTARATQMFAPALSAFNQIGGGVPIMTSGSGSQAMGEEFLANAVAKGMANAPAPIVSVEEINTTQSRVKTIETLATIA